MGNSQLDITNESQEASPFSAGDHKAHINRHAQRNSKRKTEKKHIKDPQPVTMIGTVEIGDLPVYNRQHDHPNRMLAVVLEPGSTTVKSCTDLRLPAIAWDNRQKLVLIDQPYQLPLPNRTHLWTTIDEHDYVRPGEVDETSTIRTEHSNNHGARVNSNYIRNTNIKIGI